MRNYQLHNVSQPRVGNLLWLLILPAVLLSGCDSGQQTTPAPDKPADSAELKLDIERLENALGRLEFRVFELENTTTETEAAADTAGTAAESPAASTDRYDLTPVEN